MIITVGDPSVTGPQTIFQLAGNQLLSAGDPLLPETTSWAYNPASGAVPGLLKFSFSNSKKTFVWSTAVISVGLESSIGGVQAKGPLLIRVQVFTPFDPVTPLTFETVLELQRAFPSTTKWKR